MGRSLILQHALDWHAPEHWLRIRTIDAHAEGEPLRIIFGGYPLLPSGTMLERRRYLIEHQEHLRTALMWEPRGHADMYGCLLTPPARADSDFGVLFLHNEGYSSMCGHGIIAVTKVAVELGLVPMQTPVTTVKLDTPSGLVTSHARVEDGVVQSVYFHNVPSFVLALDASVELPGLGTVRYDLAFGGAFYAYVNAEEVGLKCAPEGFASLIDVGKRIKQAVRQSRSVEHPFEPDLSFLYGTLFTGPATADDAHSRHVCVFADGQVDRSPTGTGVSGRLAIMSARGEVVPGDTMVLESIIGSRFTGRVVEETTFGPYQAVVPEVEGRAFITGRHEFVIDPDDPLGDGFILR
jgi:trans-L-3-hydroxyproline dehydratase